MFWSATYDKHLPRYFKSSSGRLCDIHSTDQRKYSHRSVSSDHCELFTCNKTTDTCAYNQPSTFLQHHSACSHWCHVITCGIKFCFLINDSYLHVKLRSWQGHLPECIYPQHMGFNLWQSGVVCHEFQFSLNFAVSGKNIE